MERYMPMSAPERMDSVTRESLNIINALRRGTVPGSGLERIAVGLEVEERAISQQLDYVAGGGGDIKCVRGDYGSGKTFFIARALEMAGSKGFVTSHVSVSPAQPLSRLKSVYQQICSGLRTNDGNMGLKGILDTWIYQVEERVIAVKGPDMDDKGLEEATIREIESALSDISRINSALAAGIRTYYLSNNAGNFQLSQAAVGWLSGEPNIGREFKAKAGIRGEIDDSIVVPFIRGLVRILTGAGYRGLAIAIDEAETMQGLAKAQRDKAYANLSALIDGLDRGDLPGCFFLVTGTPAFFEGPRGIRSLPSLADRLSVNSADGYPNPRQPQIALPRFDNKKLGQVAEKVISVYSKAYREVDRSRVSHRFVKAMIQKVTSRFGGRVDVIPRLFLRELVDVLDKCELYEDYDPWKSYEFDAGQLPEGLRAEEEAAIVVKF
jgi:adenosylhomocysteinase